MTASRESVELIHTSYLFGLPTAFDLKMEHTVPRFNVAPRVLWELGGRDGNLA